MAYTSLLNNGWSEAQYYDQRKKWMLQRVEDAFTDRKVSAAAGNAAEQHKARVDAATLRDDKPKLGKAVTLIRDNNSVDDADIAMIQSSAQREANWDGRRNSALEAARSLLGRAPGTSPTYTESEATDWEGIKYTQRNYDYSLTQGEVDALKKMDKRTLLDRFFGTDTSKY